MLFVLPAYPCPLRLRKLACCPGGQVPGRVAVGACCDGIAPTPPTVGQRFFLAGADGTLRLLTSRVQEVLDPFTFRTCNSIYRIELLASEQEPTLEQVRVGTRQHKRVRVYLPNKRVAVEPRRRQEEGVQGIRQPSCLANRRSWRWPKGPALRGPRYTTF